MIYERKIKEDLDCGIVVAMKVLGAKWRPCIIDGIDKGHHRPSELHKYIPEATPRVLDLQLSELYGLGIVVRQTKEGFPLHSEYFLSDLGRTMVPIVRELEKWGDAHKTTIKDRLDEAV